MCQLLGMNCAAPTDFSFSLKGFCRRGGATDKHSHGWGAAIYEGRGLRCFHDTLPACKSPIAELIQNYNIRTYVRHEISAGACLACYYEVASDEREHC